MTPELLTALIFVFILAGIMLGYPIVFVIGGVAGIFGLIVYGSATPTVFATTIYSTITNYVLIAVPLFVLMGNLLERSGIAESLFGALRYLLGPVRGGIALAVVSVCIVFAACTGIVGASVVTMGVLAIPPMLKYGYDKSLTTGTVAAGGSLGILIPPSIMLVIMGSQARVNVGQLFAGAFVPGVMLGILYMIYIFITCNIKPHLGPPLSLEERKAVPVVRRLKLSVINLIPPLLLILGVLGSILAGIATPTEAAGVGAFLVLLMMVGYRRFSLLAVKEAVFECAKTSGMVLLIAAAATCFSSVFVAGGCGEVIKNAVLGLEIGKWGVLVIIMLVYFLLGMLMDWVAIVFITFPIFMPIASELGFDTIWFMMLIAINLQSSFLTPPFGYALFYLKSIVPPEVKMIDIYRGIVPFVLIIGVVLILCVFFPEIILWLPSIMVG